MAYPINENKFVEICLKSLGEYDDLDREWAHTVAAALNRAYYAGVEQGSKEAAACKE